jgi:transposase
MPYEAWFRDAMKIVFFDGTGMCLFYKRLDRRNFRLPEDLVPGATSVAIEERELEDLLDGVAVEEPTAAPRSRVH